MALIRAYKHVILHTVFTQCPTDWRPPQRQSRASVPQWPLDPRMSWAQSWGKLFLLALTITYIGVRKKGPSARPNRQDPPLLIPETPAW